MSNQPDPTTADLQRLNAELLAALVALDKWVDDGEYANFAPIAQIHGMGPTEQQIERGRVLNAQVRAAIGSWRVLRGRYELERAGISR